MKFSTMFKIFVAIILIAILIFAGLKLSDLRHDNSKNDVEHPKPVEPTVIVRIDTVETVVTIYDTIYASADTIYVNVNNDTIAAYSYFPEAKYLSGNIDIEYNYTKKHFNIVSNLEVQHEIVTKIVKQPYELPPKLFRPSAMAGYFTGKDGGVLMLGAGVTLMDRLSINVAALSNEMIGGAILYEF